MKKDRHAMVEVKCETCGKTFSARKARVDNGLGRFCSKNCYYIDERERNKYTWGRKDLAKTYNVGGRYAVRWYGENGETHSESYARWWWEMNVGEIPDKMIAMYKDNNPLNVDPSNIYLGTKSDALVKGNATRKKDVDGWNEYIEKSRVRQTGFKHTPESKAKISKIHKGKKITDEQKIQMGNTLRKAWRDGVFDNVHKGEHGWRWRGGVTAIPYPLEFDKDLKNFIKSRDNYQCQICAKSLYKTKHAHVHHIDGDKQNTDQDNLILLCSVCHGKVHAGGVSSPAIMAMHSKLNYQDKENNK